VLANDRLHLAKFFGFHRALGHSLGNSHSQGGQGMLENMADAMVAGTREES
jgi:hypothetical protein